MNVISTNKKFPFTENLQPKIQKKTTTNQKLVNKNVSLTPCTNKYTNNIKSYHPTLTQSNRKIFKARRRNNSPTFKQEPTATPNDLWKNGKSFNVAQELSKEKRKGRKRNYQLMSAGSVKLAKLFEQSKTTRIHHHSLVYVRVNQPTPIKPKLKLNKIDSTSKMIDAFSMMMLSGGKSNEETKENSVENDIQLVDKDEKENFKEIFQGITDEWVQVFSDFEKANDKQWLKNNPNGKIHEYQIQCMSHILILNVGELKMDDSDCDEEIIKNYVDDNGFSGYKVNGKCYLHFPQKYWRLLDDHKIKGYSQSLISDLFGIATNKRHPFQSKPKKSGSEPPSEKKFKQSKLNFVSK